MFSTLALFAAAAVSCAHAQMASFDCRQAQTDTEWAICNTPELGKLDIEMATMYRLLGGMAPSSSTFTEALRQEQNAWIGQKRNACAGAVGCLAQAYQGRVSALGQLARSSFCLRQ